MVRVENWPKELSDYLSEMKDSPFEWGQNDCVLFAAKAIERITGSNFYFQYLPYDSEESAKKIILENGGIAGLVSKHLGPGSRNILSAKRGDLVLMKVPSDTLGIVDDSGQRIASVGPNGIARLPLSKAWRVWGV